MRKSAFTLIELLVVIAIIAILAAILFPVFAQAKAAAKATQSISNMKQIGTSVQIYIADYDDRMPARKTAVRDSSGSVVSHLSWKQNNHPYAKSTEIFRDPSNTSAVYPDETSDEAFQALNGRTVAGPTFARGYVMYDLGWFLTQAWNDGIDNVQTYTVTQVEQPSNTIAFLETKEIYPDIGPYIGWAFNAPDPDGVVRMQGWNYGGSKWDDRAMVIIFTDTHAKRTAMNATCGADDELNMWHYVRNDLPTMPLTDLSWYDTFCQTLPEGF